MKIRNRNFVDKVIGTIATFLILPPLFLLLGKHPPMLTDLLTFYATVLALVGAMYMGRSAFPHRAPEKNDDEIADGQANFWVGSVILGLAVCTAAPSLLHSDVVTIVGTGALAVGFGVTLYIKLSLPRNEKEEKAETIWGALLRGMLHLPPIAAILISVIYIIAHRHEIF